MFSFILINIDWSLLFSFLIGVGVGIALLALIYLIIVLSTLTKKKYIVKTRSNDISEEEVYKLIRDTQAMFKDSNIKGEQANVSFAKDLSVELATNIAIKFFPDSKHPLSEITIDELLMLTVYISQRLEEILSHRGLKIFRKFKLSTIISFTEIKEKVEANNIVKATKKYKIMQALSAAKKVINIINPIYWARKFLVTTSLNIVIKKLCVIVIGIVGEETYKIYSKSVFNKTVDLDTGVDDLVNDIKSDLVEVVDDDEELNPTKTKKNKKTKQEEVLLLENTYNDNDLDQTKEKKQRKGFFSLFRRKK